MPQKLIPQTTVYRLSLYLRELERLEKEKRYYISSRELGKLTLISEAQIRRDLSYFGKFGETRLGYPRKVLIKNLRQILGIDNRVWKIALIGAGNLGKALLSYRGFRERGFFIKVIFDADPEKIGKNLKGIRIENIENLIPISRKEKLDMAIIAVPAEEAQKVALEVKKAGIKAILNFAPRRLNLPAGIIVKNVDLSMELENISFHLKRLKCI
ncbi:MAG: redox-sensing transcriptional repressor Rex [Candidatus Omnitrophica bacterium]|nr:redox-sensing transcriptional repressor Rex [Candidatus Omnitrophota bacterium]MCM8793197.1 redox-sensing transcriptional repressor Rex [Candidatus Omnitrophota bacterium]